MRFAKRHATMAKALATRPDGVSVKELAKAIGRSERLANAIITHVLQQGGYWLTARSTMNPGPRPRALMRMSPNA